MARKPAKKPTKPKGGRPPSDPAAVTLGLERLDAGDPEQAVALSGLSLATLYRAQAKRRAAKRGVAPAVPQASPVAPVAQTLVQVQRAVPPSPPSDPDADLDAAAIDPAASDEDTLIIARRLLRVVEGRLKNADEVRFASLVEKASGLINRVEQIEARRPKAPAKDEVLERIMAKRDEALERIMANTKAAARKLAQDRRDLATWAAQELAPRVAAELLGKVDAMLGSAA